MPFKPIFNLLYYVFSMFYLAKMLVLWGVFFESRGLDYVNYIIYFLTFVLIFLIPIQKFQIFTTWAQGRGGFDYNLMIFSWVAFSGLATIYGQVLSFFV